MQYLLVLVRLALRESQEQIATSLRYSHDT